MDMYLITENKTSSIDSTQDTLDVLTSNSYIDFFEHTAQSKTFSIKSSVDFDSIMVLGTNAKTFTFNSKTLEYEMTADTIESRGYFVKFETPLSANTTYSLVLTAPVNLNLVVSEIALGNSIFIPDVLIESPADLPEIRINRIVDNVTSKAGVTFTGLNYKMKDFKYNIYHKNTSKSHYSYFANKTDDFVYLAKRNDCTNATMGIIQNVAKSRNGFFNKTVFKVEAT
jgi:hypothetical protein